MSSEGVRIADEATVKRWPQPMVEVLRQTLGREPTAPELAGYVSGTKVDVDRWLDDGGSIERSEV